MSGCTQCGTCCLKYGMRLEASGQDIAKWMFDGREDILRHVLIRYDEKGEVSEGILWVDENGNKVASCPFLRSTEDKRYFCGIQDAKPEVCSWHFCEKYYPFD
ncbi:zinc/iron-chelating domain-containing protein [Methanocella sp. CWC-04]|uniref:Zinc/iron-chelating domain-containing protein n=1 Tax=Methanooceanicella nereidis TaxID=2052831 RepID=A0AAP2RBI5_9EURY|nr:YkgJ family cysteine cluster protein [Methanocella sp. CWC-04]MCD1294159.1 zinc/iron-chelating domain-containing protein [Methanocella sp. CWC-04]